jgi:hypothetical protein
MRKNGVHSNNRKTFISLHYFKKLKFPAILEYDYISVFWLICGRTWGQGMCYPFLQSRTLSLDPHTPYVLLCRFCNRC